MTQGTGRASKLMLLPIGKEIRDRATGDLGDRAAQIEKQIGLNLHRSASNFLLYRRFAKEYFRFWHKLYDFLSAKSCRNMWARIR